MTAEDLLTKIEGLGVVLRAAGDRLQYRPREAIAPELLDDLRANKQELLKLLRSRPSVAAAFPGEVEARWPAAEADLLVMQLCEFADAQCVVEVFSQVLDENVTFASDNATVDPGDQRVVYRAAELRGLIGLRPEDLRIVHDVKRALRGTIRPN